MAESQNEEFKESWRNDHLDTICAFANSSGGKIYIGKKDNGTVIGVRNHKKLLDIIPNTVKNKLGFLPDVVEECIDGKYVVIITVVKQSVPINLNGRIFIRSGSSTFELSGNDIYDFIMEYKGLRWAELTDHDHGIDDLSERSLEYFVSKGKETGRISENADPKNTKAILDHLELINNDGLSMTATLLFHETPEKFVTGAYIQIGEFTDNGILKRDDYVYGPVICQPE